MHCNRAKDNKTVVNCILLETWKLPVSFKFGAILPIVNIKFFSTHPEFADINTNI